MRNPLAIKEREVSRRSHLANPSLYGSSSMGMKVSRKTNFRPPPGGTIRWSESLKTLDQGHLFHGMSRLASVPFVPRESLTLERVVRQPETSNQLLQLFRLAGQ